MDMRTTTAREDAELISRIEGRDHAAFEALMRRYNGRLFRVARSILKDDSEAEDAVQDAYLDAYRHIGTFRGDAQLGTWLVRIVANQSLMRLRKQKRERVVVRFESAGGSAEHSARSVGPTFRSGVLRAEAPDEKAESPSAAMLRGEIRKLLEHRIDELPVAFRTVFTLREVEEMTVEETADALGIPPATVRSRLFRARALLRDALARDLDMATGDVFGFAGARCDRIVARVLEILAREHP